MGSKIIYWAISNRKITLFLVALTMLFGLYGYYITPKQETPDLKAPVAMITTIYPGASPEEVEKLVTSKIEDEIVKIDGYDYSNSYSNNSISTVVLRLEYGTDIDEAWTDLRQKMEDLKSQLPEECSDIEINTNLVDTAGIILAISGDKYSYEALTNYGKEIRNELRKIDGISKFEIVGEQEKEVAVDVDTGKINYLKPSLGDIVDAVKAQNVSIPSGRIEYKVSKINVDVPGEFSTIDEIKNTILDISPENGSIVSLKDISDIHIRPKDSNIKIKHNNKNAILLTGYFKEDKNIVIIGKEVSKQINKFKNNLPEDLIIDQILYQPEDVRKSVNNFIVNLIEGIIFVIIIVFIGMGSRNALIVSTAIPISILITFSVMYVLGIKVHDISIAALIVALGMLVDNAIVISDAIQNKIDKNDEKLKACIDGVKEVAVPVFTSTLTTIAAFSPLLLLSSIAGEYISDLPIIVITALLGSYLTAILVTPTMAYIFFKNTQNKAKPLKARKFFERLLIKGMSREKTTIGIGAICIVLAAMIVSQLGLQFFPKADKNILYIDIWAEKNNDISNTENLVEDISEILDKQLEIKHYTAAIGSGLPKFYHTMPITVSSPDAAQIMVVVELDKGDRFKNNYQLTDYLQEILDGGIVGGTATVKQLEIGEPIGSPIRVRLTGKSIERLGEVRQEIKEELKKIEGTVNVDDDYSDKEYEYEVKVDKEKASYFGISTYDIQKEISIALMGMKASAFKRYDRDMDIIINGNIDSIEKLANLGIKSSYTSNKVILKEFADIGLKDKIPTIKKYDRDYAVMVTSDVKFGFNPVRIQNQLTKKIERINTDGVEVAFDGEKEKIQENFGSIGNSAIFAVLLIYAILLFQFRSFIQPLIILITIPLSAIGSVFGLYFFKQPLSFTALFGMVSLMGIVVNNAIVLIDYINTERSKGRTIEEACMEATEQRFRPIMLSSITTIIGLTPLVFSGSELFRPMAISLMSGLLVSTLLTLVVIPVIYNSIESRFRTQ